jgi:glycosyltransferase involved in cell wall biosynthesis
MQPDTRQICIGFQVYLGAKWLAGTTTVASALEALRSLGPEAPKTAIIHWGGLGPQEHERLLALADQVVRVPYGAGPARPGPLWRRFGRWLQPSQEGDAPARWKTDQVRRNGVDCVFTSPLRARPDYGLPSLVWLPDFQHVYLPDMFSRAEWAERDQVYRDEIDAATRVVVKSEAVKRDLAAFAPGAAAKTRVVPFVNRIHPEAYTLDGAGLARKYHLPERFILLPNQFWKHKNHELVLEALHRLQARGTRPVVVCTGNPYDHRSSQYLSDLLRNTSLWNLREQFILLGILPDAAEVAGLMRQALCLLNPSLFEGFGNSVVESKLLGKRALLSDLPVHREHDAPQAVYFDPHDAGDLADKLDMIWQTAQPGPDDALEAAARAAFPERQRAFGRAFLAVAREATAARQPA